MKNKDIHNDLDKKEIRNFLSLQLRATGWYSSSEEIQREIQRLQDKLEKAKIREGIQEIIKAFNWKSHDISDEIEDYDKPTYFEFIGTDDEYNEIFENK